MRHTCVHMNKHGKLRVNIKLIQDRLLFGCVYVYMYVCGACMCFHEHVPICMWVYVGVCEGQRPALGIFFSCSVSSPLRQTPQQIYLLFASCAQHSHQHISSNRNNGPVILKADLTQQSCARVHTKCFLCPILFSRLSSSEGRQLKVTETKH